MLGRMGLGRVPFLDSPKKSITHNPNYGLWIKGFAIQLIVYNPPYPLGTVEYSSERE